MALGVKQARFVAEYLKDLNATQAAIRAGYSVGTAHVQGPRLLSNVRVRAEIDAALKRRAERVEVRADDILRELLRLATVDIGQAFNVDGTLKPIHEIPEDVRRAMSGVEVEEFDHDDGPTGRVRKVKFWDKTRGLELLGKHLKLFVDRVEHSGGLTLEQIIAKAAEEERK